MSEPQNARELSIQACAHLDEVTASARLRLQELCAVLEEKDLPDAVTVERARVMKIQQTILESADAILKLL